MSAGRNEGSVESESWVDVYWLAIYRRKWLVLLIAAVSGVLAGLISLKLPPRYESTTVFYVPSDSEGSVGIGPHLLDPRLPSGKQDHAKAYAMILKHSDAWEAISERVPGKPLGRYFLDLDVVATREAVIKVHCRDGDPQVAADIANAMVEYFDEFQEAMILDQLYGSFEKLDEGVEKVEGEIADLRHARRLLLEEYGVASLDTQILELERDRIRLLDRLLEAQVEMAGIELEIAGLEDLLRAEDELYQERKIVINDLVVSYLEQVASQKRVDLAGLETLHAEDHPDLVQLQAELEEAEELLDQQIAGILGSASKQEGSLYAGLRQQHALLLANREGAGARLERLTTAVDELDEKLHRLPALEAELEQADQRIQRRNGFLASIETTRSEMVKQALQLRRTAVVIQRAKPMSRPSFPNIPLNVAVAVLFGLLVGLMYALLLHHVQERRRTRRLIAFERERWAQAAPTGRQGVEA